MRLTLTKCTCVTHSSEWSQIQTAYAQELVCILSATTASLYIYKAKFVCCVFGADGLGPIKLWSEALMISFQLGFPVKNLSTQKTFAHHIEYFLRTKRSFQSALTAEKWISAKDGPPSRDVTLKQILLQEPLNTSKFYDCFLENIRVDHFEPNFGEPRGGVPGREPMPIAP